MIPTGTVVKVKGVLIAGVAIALIAIAWTAYSQREPQKEGPLEAVSFRLKWFVYSSFAHYFVAQDQGCFRTQGLDVHIRGGGAGIDPIKLVASGADDAGLASYGQILLAREKGIPVVAIAEEYVKSGVVFITLKASGISKPADFVGRTVGFIPGSDTGTVYEALMSQQGIDRSKIREVPVGFDLAILFDGKVDVLTAGFISNQPIVAEQKGYPVNVIDPYEYGIRLGGNVLFTSEETLKKRRHMLKRFLDCVLKGIIDAQQLPDDKVVDLVMAQNERLDRAAELKVWKVTKDVLLSHDPKTVGLMAEATWLRTAELFKKFGLLKSVPALRDSYSNELVVEVLKEGL